MADYDPSNLQENASQTDGSNGLMQAGQVQIKCILTTMSGEEKDLHQFIGEINIFEDMFGNGLQGNILIIDAANLTQNLPIVGEEYIKITLQTPSMDDFKIEKTYKIYSITNRMTLSDVGKTSYVLHFCSVEMYLDMISPVYKTFKGKTTEIAAQIFNDYIAIPRNGNDEPTALKIVGTSTKETTFTSPGWSPMKCLNWLGSRSLDDEYKAPGYLFFETNKQFYWANMEALIDLSIKDKSIYQRYVYMAKSISGNSAGSDPTTGNDAAFSRNIELDFQKVEDFELVTTYNNFKNVQNGYYANRVFTLDLLSKKYVPTEYDHIASYADYKHLEMIAGKSAAEVAPFPTNALRGAASYTQFYPKHERLYGSGKESEPAQLAVNDTINEVLPKRVSLVNELTNFKLIITVQGRCDIELGAIIYFSYPDGTPSAPDQKNENKEDDYYSGFYLVTAIRHKVTLTEHKMILEIVKDSLHTKA
jgi:hypothetical protein